MRWRYVPILLALESCGGGDEEACERAENIKAELLDQKARDGFSDAPCALSAATRAQLPADRVAEYEAACAEFEREQQKCEG